jgi:hypothetical protein
VSGPPLFQGIGLDCSFVVSGVALAGVAHAGGKGQPGEWPLA